ncbi:MAG: PKD domain-containing protein [Bacteroidetes bacterium]|nr:PKD domain-containing protein [Bacteroidota bacterium]
MNTKNFTQKLWKAALLVAVFFIGFNNLKAGSTNNDDVGLSAFLSPVTNVCGDSNTLITVTLNNIGKNSQSKIPIVVKISGSATATYKDTFYSSLSSGGTTSFSFILKLNTFSGGTFSLKAYTAMSTDQDAANDTILTSVTINPQAPTPTVTGASACGFTSLTLRASSAPKGAKNVWYNASTGGSIIATGDSFVTPFISSTTTYYVETAYPKYYSTGKPNKTTGTGGNYTAYADGLVFEAFSDFTFDSVTVYPNASGRVVMRLTDSATGNIIDSHSVAVKVTTANDPIRIPVGYKIKAGKYRLFATGTTTGGMYRNTGSGGIPYSVAGILSITRTINNLAGYYYFFYDWKISNYTGCPSARVAVTATITSGSKPTVSFTTKGSCLGTATTFTDGSSAASGTTLTKFKYDFGDGNTYTSTSTGSTTHTYASAGTYKITYYVTASNGCSDTSGTFITITAGSTPNFTTSSSCGGVVTFTDASVVSGTITSYDYDFGDTSTYSSSTTGSTTHTYKYAGNHTVKFSLTNSGGCTFTKTQTVTATISPNAPTGTGASACGYSSLVLKANTPPSGAKNYWYNVSSGGTSLATGDSFVTPFISATTNFYVEAAYTTSGRLGAKDNTIGAGGNNATVTNGLIFYALSDFTLDSLTVYPNNTGTMNVVIKIRDSATKKVVDSVIRSVTTSTAFQKVRIAVGIKVPKGGAYTIDGEGSSTGGFYRNTAGGKIPYVLTGVAKITETKNSLASTGYYYYFYDWLVSASSCPSSRTTVTATITSGSTPTVKFSALPSCSGSPSLFLDSSKAASGGSIASYTYQFGDGNTMNTTSNKVTHTYTTTGTFKVTLLVRGGNGCADTMSKFITIVNGPKAGVTASYVCTGSTASFNPCYPYL